jgi:hypothetical protein
MPVLRNASHFARVWRGTTADKVRKGHYANLMLHKWTWRAFGSVRRFERDGP